MAPLHLSTLSPSTSTCHLSALLTFRLLTHSFLTFPYPPGSQSTPLATTTLTRNSISLHSLSARESPPRAKHKLATSSNRPKGPVSLEVPPHQLTLGNQFVDTDGEDVTQISFEQLSTNTRGIAVGSDAISQGRRVHLNRRTRPTYNLRGPT